MKLRNYLVLSLCLLALSGCSSSPQETTAAFAETAAVEETSSEAAMEAVQETAAQTASEVSPETTASAAAKAVQQTTAAATKAVVQTTAAAATAAAQTESKTVSQSNVDLKSLTDMVGKSDSEVTALLGQGEEVRNEAGLILDRTYALSILGENANVSLTFNFDSSGTLKTQIEEGADCDLFLSAGQKQMDQLDLMADSGENPDGLDFILHESRIDLLENKVVLVVPEGSETDIDSFDALASRLRDGDILLAMGNSDVPVGQYTQNILQWYGLDEEALAQKGCITYGSNVKEVVTQVSEGSVDAGVIYCTDAFSAGLSPVDEATADMCGQVIYPAAVTKSSLHQEEAMEFLNYLTGEEAMAVFERVGFSPAE